MKKTSKSLLAFVLSLVMILGSFPYSALAAEQGEPGTLTERFINEATGKEISEPVTTVTTDVKKPMEIKGHEYESYSESVEYVYSRNDLTYLYGYPDKTVRGERYLSRAEASAIFYRLYDGEYPKSTRQMTSSTFSDINDDAWYLTEVETLYNIGIVNGYEDGTFKPEQPVTRAEFAQLTSLFAELERVDKNFFTDVTKDHWAYNLVNAAASAGWISGYGDGSYKPDQDITRAETVAMINHMINREVTVGKLNEMGVENPYVDLAESYWAYTDLIEATVKHTATDWHEISYNDGNINIVIERFVDRDGNVIGENVVSPGKERSDIKDFKKHTYMGYVSEVTYVYHNGKANMEVSKSVDKSSAKVGDQLQYTIEVLNSESATDNLKNAVARDVLSEYVDFVHGSVQIGKSSGEYSYDKESRELTVNLGDLEPGQKKTVTFDVTVNDTAYGKSFINTVVASADNDEDGSGTDGGVEIEEGKAEMSIKKSVNKAKAKVGDQIQYTVEVGNDKSATANLKNAKVEDVLSGYLTFSHGSVQVDGVTAAYSYDNDGQTLIVELDEIAPGQTKKLTFECTINSTAYGQSFKNTAVASADNDGDGSGTDGGVTVDDGTPEGSAGAKTVSASTAKVGDTLTYTITLRNASNATAPWKAVKVTDKIPEHLVFVDGSVEEDGRASTNSSYNSDSKTLTLFADSIEPGATRTFTFKVTVSDGAQGLYIVNTAVISSDDRDDIQLPDTGVQIDAGAAEPSISKKASVAEALEGDVFKYTITMKNGVGASSPWKNVILSDVIPDGLKLVAGSMTLNGETVSYGISGQAIEVTVGDLSAGAETIVEFEVRVQENTAGTTITNTAVAKGGNGEKTGTDEGVEIPKPDGPGDPGGPDDSEKALSGSKTVNKTIVNTGEKVTFAITAKNTTDETWSSVQVYDVLDTSMLTFIHDTVHINGIRYAQAAGKWTFTDKQLVINLGDIESGKEVKCEFTVQFKNDAADSTYINNATIRGMDDKVVYVKSPEITIINDGSGPPDTGSDVHYLLYAGIGDHLGNPLFLFGPDDDMKLDHMCIVGYRLMTDNYKELVGNGSISVPSTVTQREAQYFISQGVLNASEYTSGASATQSQIYRILNFALRSGLDSNSTSIMKRIDVATLICELTRRDKNPNTNGLPVAYFSDKGARVGLIDEVSNTHDYTLDSSGKETWISLSN